MHWKRNVANRIGMMVILLLIAGGAAWGQTLPFEGAFSDTPFGTLQDGTYSMQFALFDSETGGVRVWPSMQDVEEHPFVEVNSGRFRVNLGSQGFPIPSSIQASSHLWVAVGVCQPAGYECQGHEPLPIRLSLNAESPMSLETPLPGSSGEIAYEEVGGVVFGASGDAWLLGGNSGTIPLMDFVGTTDDAPLYFRVGGKVAFRLEYHPTSPNVLGGHGSNGLSGGVYGGTIAGGSQNTIQGSLGSIAGGASNIAGSHAFVGGGYGNRAMGSWSSVIGGSSNLASAMLSFAGGGQNNTAEGESSVVLGGEWNVASGSRSTISGGGNNTSSGSYSAVIGGLGNTSAGSYSITGGSNNSAHGDYAVALGGSFNIATGDFSIVLGGSRNQALGATSLVGGRNGATTSQATGSFVWAGNHDLTFESNRPNEFLVRATGGMFVQGGMSDVALRAEVGRTDLAGWRTSMISITGRIGDWTDGSLLDVKTAAVSGLALKETSLYLGQISVGVWGQSTGTGIGVLGESIGSDAESIGVLGSSRSSHGVFGETHDAQNGSAGGYFRAHSDRGEVYGVVGQAESSDGFGVYSKGNAHIDGDLSWSEKISYVSLGPLHFLASEPTASWVGNDREWTASSIIPKSKCSFRRANPDDVMLAPLHLPQGARLDSIQFHYSEAGGDADSWLILGRADFAGNATILARIDTPGNMPDTYHDDCGNHIVDNSTGSYYVSMGLDCKTTFYGVEITYGIREPY